MAQASPPSRISHQALPPSSDLNSMGSPTSPRSRMMALNLDANSTPIHRSPSIEGHSRYDSTSTRFSGSGSPWDLKEGDSTRGLTPLPSPFGLTNHISSGGSRTRSFFSSSSSGTFSSPPLRMGRDRCTSSDGGSSIRTDTESPTKPNKLHPLNLLVTDLGISNSTVDSPIDSPPISERSDDKRALAGHAVGLSHMLLPPDLQPPDSISKMPFGPPSRYPTLLGDRHHKGKSTGRERTVSGDSLRGRPQHSSAPNSRAASPVPSISEPTDEEVAPGALLGGEFRVVRILGRGAFSMVMLGESESGGGKAAIKLIDKRTYASNPRFKISVVREIEVLKNIRHPCLSHLLQTFEVTNFSCLVLEYAPGGELFDLLASHHSEFTESFVRRIFGELADVVGWMHSIGLVHRDIKLETKDILLTSRPFEDSSPRLDLDSLSEPLVKLTDFGLSRFIDLDHPTLETRCGSEEYAAPELILGKAYDGRQTDSWAIGVVLYSLAIGYLPFVAPSSHHPNVAHQNPTRRSYLIKIAKADYDWPKSGPALSHVRGLRDIVDGFLVREPNKRSKPDDVWTMDWMKGPGRPKRRGSEASVRLSGDMRDGVIAQEI